MVAFYIHLSVIFQVGLIYIFNLIVGTGALTMPKAFAEAGWLVSVIGVGALAFMRFVIGQSLLSVFCTNSLNVTI